MLVVKQRTLVLDDSYHEGEWPYENTDDIKMPQINPFFEELADEDDDVKEEIKEEVFEDDL